MEKTDKEKAAQEHVAEFSDCGNALAGCGECPTRYDKPVCMSRQMYGSFIAGYDSRQPEMDAIQKKLNEATR